jgi:ABC-type phosphate transport system substrate-binding protein
MRCRQVVFAVFTVGVLLCSMRAGEFASSHDRTTPDLTVAIVVNTSNTVDDLSTGELRKIFLGRRSHWPNHRRITVVMMEPGEPERKTVLRDICHMSESDYSNHMLHGLFTGEVFVTPKTLSSPTGVRKFIFNVPGAIGYVRLADVDRTVKAIRVDGRRPDDQDYPLHIKLENPK